MPVIESIAAALRLGAICWARGRRSTPSNPSTTPPPADPPTVEQFSRAHLAANGRPRDVVLVAALPRNPSGKVLETALRAEHGSTTVVSAPAV